MRIQAVILALAALTLAGCAEDVPTIRWSKPDTSYDQFVQDRAACADEAREQSRPFYVGGERHAGRSDAVDSGIFFPCMADRGYRQDPKGFAAPPDDVFPLSP